MSNLPKLNNGTNEVRLDGKYFDHFKFEIMDNSSVIVWDREEYWAHYSDFAETMIRILDYFNENYRRYGVFSLIITGVNE